MKKPLIALAILIVIALTGSYIYFKGNRYEVVITQEQIDDTLAKKFPINKTHYLILNFTYTEPEVTLLPDNDRIQVGLNATLNIKVNDQPELSGRITIACGLRYHQDTQSFFLTGTKIEKIDIQGIPPKYQQQATLIASQYLKERLEEFPVYTLKATDTKKAAAKLLLKDVKIKAQEVHVTLGL